MLATAATIYIIIFKILSSLKLLIGIFVFLLHFFNRAYNIMKYEEHCWLCGFRSLHTIDLQLVVLIIIFINSRQNVYYDKKKMLLMCTCMKSGVYLFYTCTKRQFKKVVLFSYLWQIIYIHIITTRIIYLTTILYNYCCFEVNTMILLPKKYYI